MSILATTVPGLEDYVVKEAEKRRGSSIGHSYEKMSGRVILELGASSMAAAKSFLATMRTIENAYYLLHRGKVGPRLSDLATAISGVDLSELMGIVTPETSIAIEALRTGNHEYTSTIVASHVGDAVISFLEERGVRPLVNLSNPDVVIGVHVMGDQLLLGVRLTRSTMRDRDYRVASHPASLNPVIAFAMIMMADPGDGETICDLTCGGGTIPAEAMHYWARVRAICIDINLNYCLMARDNLNSAGSDFDVVSGDSTMGFMRSLSCDHVIFNPPYGIRMRTMTPIRTFYNELIAAAIDSARRSVVMITARRGLVAGLRDLDVAERRIEQGGMYSSIFVIRKKK
ncbi:MAG: hypothetical protein AT710_00060 [Thermocladium sp. ECH_B]|jgi:tRNA (guanine6-N2)-methyltransferase|nr:MAG: hypothetical protein AT710_00060 [Thermocladium sp. ECH_B]